MWVLRVQISKQRWPFFSMAASAFVAYRMPWPLPTPASSFGPSAPVSSHNPLSSTTGILNLWILNPGRVLVLEPPDPDLN